MTGPAKHYVALLEGVPNCNHGGGGITAYAAVKAMRERGNRVTVVALYPDRKPGNDARHIRDLEAMGISTRLLSLDPEPRKGLLPTILPSREDLFPGFAAVGTVRALLASLRPDAVFMYHWNALAATHGIREYPKLATVGDPAHLPFLFRSSLLRAYDSAVTWKTGIKNALIRRLAVPRMVRLQDEMLTECTERGAFAAHHAGMLSRPGGPVCRYLRTPTPDPLPGPRRRDPGAKFRIMHIGHLQGIATLSGVELLAKEVLPELDRIMPPGSFEVHLVGGFFETMPSELQRAMRHPALKVRGQVSPADGEFLAADVVLVPTPIELGIRVRILTAFSFGNCVVAHPANCKGIPEMKHGTNALLSTDGAGLARLCKDVHSDPSLGERIGAAARKTYEERFSLEAAGGDICDILDRIARAGEAVVAH